MATFPELNPATRAYDFGLFPLTEVPSISAGIVRFRHGVLSQNYKLTLEFNALTDAQAMLIRNHYQSQGGSYRSFLLPPIIWRGHTFTGNIAPFTTLWRYIETPEEEHFSVGYVNVTVALGSDGLVDLSPDDVVASIATNGAGGGGGGLVETVTASIVAGVATGA